MTYIIPVTRFGDEADAGNGLYVKPQNALTCGYPRPMPDGQLAARFASLCTASCIAVHWKRGLALGPALGRVAPVHCCTEAPSGPRVHVSAHAAQASRWGDSGLLLHHGVSGRPGRMSAPVAGGVYEVCSLAACGSGRVVVDQVIRRDRPPDDLQEPAFPALGDWGGWSGVSRFSPHRLHRPSCLDSRRTV